MGQPLVGYILRNLHCFSPHPFKKFRITLIITEFRFITTEFSVVSVITCTTGAQHRTLKERPILSGYRWQF